MISIRVAGGARDVIKDFITSGAKTDDAVNKVVKHYGHLLATKVKAKASGRPGPNAPTGDYRRSITAQFSREGSKSIAIIGTNAVQGRRLEFGFNGVDSLGRHYNQPPYPHFGPAFDEIEDQFMSALKTAAKVKNNVGD